MIPNVRLFRFGEPEQKGFDKYFLGWMVEFTNPLTNESSCWWINRQAATASWICIAAVKAEMLYRPHPLPDDYNNAVTILGLDLSLAIRAKATELGIN